MPDVIIRKILSRLFGPAFGDSKLFLRTLFKHIVLQKFLRINAHVPWPVHWTSQVIMPDKIERGTRFPGLSPGCQIDGRNGIILGKNVWIGPRVSLISQNHDLNDFHVYIKDRPILIGDHCWLGTNAIILPGVRLGDHVVVAAGAVVTRSFEEDDILVAGVPAKIIKQIGAYQE